MGHLKKHPQKRTKKQTKVFIDCQETEFNYLHCSKYDTSRVFMWKETNVHVDRGPNPKHFYLCRKDIKVTDDSSFLRQEGGEPDLKSQQNAPPPLHSFYILF